MLKEWAGVKAAESRHELQTKEEKEAREKEKQAGLEGLERERERRDSGRVEGYEELLFFFFFTPGVLELPEIRQKGCGSMCTFFLPRVHSFHQTLQGLCPQKGLCSSAQWQASPAQGKSKWQGWPAGPATKPLGRPYLLLLWTNQSAPSRKGRPCRGPNLLAPWGSHLAVLALRALRSLPDTLRFPCTWSWKRGHYGELLRCLLCSLLLIHLQRPYNPNSGHTTLGSLEKTKKQKEEEKETAEG